MNLKYLSFQCAIFNALVVDLIESQEIIAEQRTNHVHLLPFILCVFFLSALPCRHYYVYVLKGARTESMFDGVSPQRPSYWRWRGNLCFATSTGIAIADAEGRQFYQETDGMYVQAHQSRKCAQYATTLTDSLDPKCCREVVLCFYAIYPADIVQYFEYPIPL